VFHANLKFFYTFPFQKNMHRLSIIRSDVFVIHSLLTVLLYVQSLGNPIRGLSNRGSYEWSLYTYLLLWRESRRHLLITRVRGMYSLTRSIFCVSHITLYTRRSPYEELPLPVSALSLYNSNLFGFVQPILKAFRHLLSALQSLLIFVLFMIWF